VQTFALGQSAWSEAVASSGSLIGVTATESTAQTTGVVTSFVGDDATLRIGDSVRISASGNTKQFADVSGILGGLLAVGANDADALSNTTTQAYIGDGVSLSGGDAIGGLTTGEQYYVVLDDERPFDSVAVNTASNTVSLINGLQTGCRQYHGGRVPDLILQGAGPVALAAGGFLCDPPGC
jgi:hypothetical protein